MRPARYFFVIQLSNSRELLPIIKGAKGKINGFVLTFNSAVGIIFRNRSGFCP